MYQTLFQRLALQPAAETAIPPQEDAAPLFPKPEQLAIPADTPLPPPAETIDEPAPKPDPNSRIMHVEIE